MRGAYYSGWSELWRQHWFDLKIEKAVRFNTYQAAQNFRETCRSNFMFLNSTIEEVKNGDNL